MKNWKTSLYAQIAYMAGMGTGFTFMPAIPAGLFRLGPAEEVWIRVVGLLALVLCMYYLAAIRNSAVWFARTSVYGRYAFCAALAALGLVFDIPMLIAFAGIEAGLAAWPHWALGQSQS
jgi:hypothetical protein